MKPDFAVQCQARTICTDSIADTRVCLVISWEIAARKLDFSLVGIERTSLLLANNKGTDQTAMMSKPAYLSVEIVTDTCKPTSGKIL